MISNTTDTPMNHNKRILFQIKRVSPFSKKENVREMFIDQDDWARYTFEGVNVQDAFPYLSPDEREFIMTGILPGEWDELFENCEK